MTGPLALAILATLAGILAAGLFVLVLAWHARAAAAKEVGAARGRSLPSSSVPPTPAERWTPATPSPGQPRRGGTPPNHYSAAWNTYLCTCIRCIACSKPMCAHGSRAECTP